MRPTHLPKKLRVGGLALAALVLVGAGAIVVLGDDSGQAPRVELVSTRRGTVTAAVSAAGSTVDDGTRDLAFGGSGTVTRVYVKSGDKVSKGDVLARIGSAPARERHAAAKAQLAAAEEALDTAGSTSASTSGGTPNGTSGGTSGGASGAGTSGARQPAQSQAPDRTGSGRPGAPTQPGCVPTTTRSPQTGAAPTPARTTSAPGPTGAGQEIRVAPAAGVVPAGYHLTPTPTPVPERDPASASAVPAGASPGTPTPAPTPTPTATPTTTERPGGHSPRPAPTVTVTVTAAPTVTVTATATVTVTARPDGNGPSTTSEPVPTVRPSGPTADPGGPSEPTAAPTVTPTGAAKPTAPGTGCSAPKPGASTGAGAGGADTGTGTRAGSGSGAGGTNTGAGARAGTGAGTGAGAGAGGGSGGAGRGTLSVEQAEVRVKQARAELTDAAKELAGVRIVAPADGTVMSVAGAVGDSAGTGPFLTLGDLDELQVEALFTESDIGSLELGQQATITLATRQEDRYPGTVTGIAPTATTTDRLVRYGVTVAFDTPPANLLVGQTASVTVTVAESAEALYVPAQAVRTKDGVSRVTVQDDGERVVETGVRSDRYIEITSGLSENDRVVLPGAVDGEFPDGSWPEAGTAAP